MIHTTSWPYANETGITEKLVRVLVQSVWIIHFATARSLCRLFHNKKSPAADHKISSG